MSTRTRNLRAVLLVAAIVALPLVARALRDEGAIEADVVVAKAQHVRPTILATGTLAYAQEVNLTSEVVAKVREILVEEGDMVEEGQVLLRLDPESYRNAVRQESAGHRQSAIGIERQRATLRLREAQYQRSRELATMQLIEKSRLDEDYHALQLARNELASSNEILQRSQAALGEAIEQLGKTEIRSPIRGHVVELPIKIGETALPSTSALAGAQLMKIADTSVLIAELKVDEADIGKVEIGQKVDVFPAAYSETAIPGRIEQIALTPSIERQARAYKVTVRLADARSLKLRSGMTVRADLHLGNGAAVVAAPVEAVIPGDDGFDGAMAGLWVIRKGRAHRLDVQTGHSDDRWQGIVSGLAPGELIIAGPAKVLRQLKGGERVESRRSGGSGGTEAKTRGRGASST